jgi:AcrR family transcriptional regulator
LKKLEKPASLVENRRGPLIDAAAELFATKGFAATSTRDIAAAVDMRPGSIYYHFRSKEDILLAVYHEGVARFVHALDAALLTASNDPWVQLEKACAAHLTVLLDSGPYAKIIGPEFIRTFPADIQVELIADRDKYEARFDALISAVPMHENVDRWLFKAALFGSLNWASIWYRPGKLEPVEISGRFLDFFASVRK